MKQIKKEPQAPRLPLALETVVLTSALAAQEKLIGLEINDDLWPEEKALGKEFSECRLTKVTMAAISEKTYFVDVIFDHCDFSNCQLSESTLRRICRAACCRTWYFSTVRSIIPTLRFPALRAAALRIASARSLRSARGSLPPLRSSGASWMKVSFSTVILTASICRPVRLKASRCAATS